MADSIFAVPELVGLIASYLSPQDRARCMRTCKQLHSTFLPFHWTSFTTQSYKQGGYHPIWAMTHGQGAQRTLQNRHRIQSLELEFFANTFLAILLSSDNIIKTGTAATTSTGTAVESKDLVESDSMSFPPCTNLRRLRVKVGRLEAKLWRSRDSICPSMAIVSLLQTNLRLTELDLPSLMLKDVPMAEKVAAAIQFGLPKLEKLHFNANLRLTLPIETGLMLLEAVTGRTPVDRLTLTEFTCNFQVTMPVQSGSPERDLARAEFGSRFKGKFGPECRTGIRKLKLPFPNGDWPMVLLDKLFRNCFPDVESLDLVPVAEDEVHWLGQVLRESCPKLVHLTGDTIFARGESGEEYQSVVETILACKRDKGDGLRSIHFQYYEDLGEIQEAIEGHASTLEEVTFSETEQLDSETVLWYLTHCPHLVKFSLPDCQNQSVALQFSDVLGNKDALGIQVAEGHEWVCKGLKTLRLTLGRGIDEVGELFEDQVDQVSLHGSDTEPEDESESEEEDEDESGGDDDNIERRVHEARVKEPVVKERVEMPLKKLDKVVARKVFAQIGKLTKLEELAIWYEYEESTDWYSGEDRYRQGHPFKWDFTMAVGLSSLRGLKKLKHLFLTRQLWQKMGQAEVEFMAKEWPSLERIIFDKSSGSKVLEVVELPHWKWLREYRPEIRIRAEAEGLAMAGLSVRE